MYVLNFLVAILLPYIGIFNKIAPPESVPDYFFSEEAAFLADELYVVILYWAGFLRNYIRSRKFNERHYFLIVAAVFAYLCVSKLILSVPFVWITSIFAFGLGTLSVTPGQRVHKFMLAIMICISVFIFLFASFILLGMAWFNFTPMDYYIYKNLLFTSHHI